MINYKETTGEASAYTRCNRIFIENPKDGSKRVTFNEEKLVNINGEAIKQEIGSCTAIFNPVEIIPLIDIATLEPTGETITHLDAYKMLFSLYIATAKHRDELQNAIIVQQQAIDLLRGY
mgnify:CR=1 FL=1